MRNSREITLNIGGKLSTGDVVGVSYNNCIVFGWFVESGMYGSLKYISFRAVQHGMEVHQSFLSGSIAVNSFWDRKFKKEGLTFKCFHKDYIVNFSAHTNRAFKVPNPEEFFTGSQLEEMYVDGKKVLNDLKFPAK